MTLRDFNSRQQSGNEGKSGLEKKVAFVRCRSGHIRQTICSERFSRAQGVLAKQ